MENFHVFGFWDFLLFGVTRKGSFCILMHLFGYVHMIATNMCSQPRTIHLYMSSQQPTASSYATTNMSLAVAVRSRTTSSHLFANMFVANSCARTYSMYNMIWPLHGTCKGTYVCKGTYTCTCIYTKYTKYKNMQNIQNINYGNLIYNK